MSCVIYLYGSALQNGFAAITTFFLAMASRKSWNLQPRGSLAKAYQVKQVRNVIVRYKLVGELDGD
jgi:hypothetical protein